MFFSADEVLLYPAHGLVQKSNLTRVCWVKAWEDGPWDGLDLSLQYVLPFEVYANQFRGQGLKRRELVSERQGTLPLGKEKEQQQSIGSVKSKSQQPQKPSQKGLAELGRSAHLLKTCHRLPPSRAASMGPFEPPLAK